MGASEVPRIESGSRMDEPLPRRNWALRRKAAIQAICAIAVLAAASLLIGARVTSTVEQKNLLIETVQQGALDSVIPARAQVVPIRSEVVEAADSARVAQVLVKDGDLVEEGQPIARLSNPGLEVEVQRYEATALEQIGAIRASQISLERLRADLENSLAQADHAAQKARRERAKLTSLEAEGFVSKQMLDDAVAEERFASSRLDLARSQWADASKRLHEKTAQADQQAARLEQAIRTNHKLLDALEIRAPLSGRVTGLNLLVGRQLQRGERIAQVDAAAGVKLVAAIDQHYLPKVTQEQEVRVLLHDGQARGRITRVLPQVQQGRFQVEIELDKATQMRSLQRGQQLDIEVLASLSEERETLFLEQGPFLADAMQSGRVYRVSRDGSEAELVPVTFGRRSTRRIEVLAGLTPGDRIIASAYSQFGQRATLHIRQGSD
ncbi:MAG: efflux RND transporter periplasmic adaptor subunit [Hyphomonadaceae bacterium]|jgi:HlyD family secretion protein